MIKKPFFLIIEQKPTGILGPQSFTTEVALKLLYFIYDLFSVLEDEEVSDEKQDETMNQELLEITSEISLKQKLIEELETSQKRLHIMKQQYETKLLALEQRITTTQEERDKVLKNISRGGVGQTPEKINKVKQEYNEKLSKLQGEVS